VAHPRKKAVKEEKKRSRQNSRLPWQKREKRRGYQPGVEENGISLRKRWVCSSKAKSPLFLHRGKKVTFL